MGRVREEARVRGERANPGDHDSGTDRQGDADTEHGDDGVCFRVIAILERVIPLIKHLRDGSADANRQNRRDSQTLVTAYVTASVTRIRIHAQTTQP